MADLWTRFTESKFFKDNYQVDKLLMPISVIIGVTVGFVIDGADDLSPKERRFSSVLGWTYFFCWAISFWPQVVTNYFNETTHGLAADKYILDLVGFTALSLYECFMYYGPSTRADYQELHDGNTPRVAINDVWYALHSLMLTFIVIYQIILYDGFTNLPSLPSFYLSGTLTAISIIFYIAYNFWSDVVPWLTWLNCLYVLSNVKVIITCFKFLPQVILNYQRKATRGWNIYGTWLDLAGSVLSISQLVFDCIDKNDFSGIKGNSVKVLLGAVSAVYDITFIIQHYYLYPGTGDDFSITAMETMITSPGATPKELRKFLKVRGHRVQYNSVIARLNAEFHITDEEAHLLRQGDRGKSYSVDYGTQLMEADAGKSYNMDYGTKLMGTDGAHVNPAFSIVRENSMIGGV